MLEVTVTNQATKQAVTVKINGYDSLTPKSAIAARNVAQGSGNAAVSDGHTTYYVTKSGAKKYNG